MSLTFGSVCSGIEAASVAWEPLGWRAVWVAEIEPFPCALLAHRFPGTPNLGDMTTIAPRIAVGEVTAPDVLVGGTPCQSFSVAGLRKGLADDRGNLALEFIRLADAIDAVRRAIGQPPAFILWENVPGVLSDTGNAFGTFLAGLVGSDAPLVPRGRWTDAGVVHGPGRCAAWRVLDAQFHGLAQRRERVFVLACGGAGAWAAADALLPVIEGVRWHPSPRREAREGVAGALATRPDRGGVNSEGSDGKLIPQLANTLGAKKDGGWRGDLDHDTYVPGISPTLKARDFKGPSSDGDGDGDGAPLIAHTLRAAGFDASEDGTGRGTPLVAVAAPLTAGGHPNSNAPGRRKEDDTNLVAEPLAFTQNQRGEVREIVVAGALAAEPGMKQQSYVAFDIYGVTATSGATPTDVHTSLRARPPGGSEASTTTVITVTSSGHGWWDEGEVGATIRAQDSVTKADTLAVRGMAVRRLTPRECERLQGFPDDWTLVPHRGKPAADGPRYRALGNSMAVPVMRAIGEGIARAAETTP